MITSTHLTEGLRMFYRRTKVAAKGIKRYEGDAKQICEQIVKDCWNSRFFQTSTGHFCQFYTRDFGICVDSLIKLGFRDKCIKTLRYALNTFSKQNKITTAIAPKGKAFDFPYYAVDSLPLLIRSLRAAEAEGLIEEHKDFLNKEIKKFYELVINRDSGLVKQNKVFSSMKDFSIRQSSCYDNVMVAMLNDELKKIKILENPLKSYNFKKLIKQNFWNNNYFLDDLSGKSYVAADANIFPFWTKVFDELNMMKKAFKAIQQEGLDSPFPIKYTKNKQKMIFVDFFVPGYEANKIWTNMGPLYVGLLKMMDKAKAEKHINKYKEIIERYKNYFEVFDESEKPFKTLFYYADEGMLWSANYLSLLN